MKTTWQAFRGSLITQATLTLARPTFQIVLVLQPIVMATIAFMLYRNTTQASDFMAFVVVGSGIAGMWSSIAFSSAGDINRERAYGTLSALFFTPTSMVVIMLGKIAANALLSAFSLVVSLVFAGLVLRVPLTVAYPWVFVLGLVMFLVATNLFALALSSLFLVSRSTAVMQNFLEYPILIISGIFFPITLLPRWAQIVGWPIPLTWGGELMRLAVGPELDTHALMRNILILGGLSVFYLGASRGLFQIIGRRVRVTAQLDLY